jgi:hypothetical protein
MSTIFRRTSVQRGAAVGATAVGALVLWAGTGGDPVVRAAGGAEQHVGAASVVITTVVAGLAGWALLAVLERTTRRAYAIWVTVATLVFMLSLVPMAMAAVGAASLGALLGLHVLVYTLLTTAFGRTGQSVSAARCVKPAV